LETLEGILNENGDEKKESDQTGERAIEHSADNRVVADAVDDAGRGDRA